MSRLRSTDESSDGKIDENKAVYEVRSFGGYVEDIEFFGRSEFAWVPVRDSWHFRLTLFRDVWVRRDGDGFRVGAHSDGDVITLSNRSLPLNYAMGVAEDWARRQMTI